MKSLGQRNKRHCETCDDDGWIETFGDDGFPDGARECPHVGEAWHAPFNDSGLIPATLADEGDQ